MKLQLSAVFLKMLLSLTLIHVQCKGIALPIYPITLYHFGPILCL